MGRLQGLRVASRGRARAGLVAVAAFAVAFVLVRRGRGGAGPATAAGTDAFVALNPVIALNPFACKHSWLMPKIVRANFPGALPGKEVARRMLKALKPFGVDRDNTVYGHSICSDEINGDAGHLPTVLTNYFGTSFFLGGIGGAPYVGKTGFGAFAAHAPDDGNVVLVFGPHIGISPEGEPGKFRRDGQAAESTSCGAVIAAYSQLTSGTPMKADPQDMEQSWLREKLGPHCEKLGESSNLMVDLVMQAYKAVEDKVLEISNTNFGKGHLILLGGIQINMPYPLPGYWVPLHFSVRAAGKQTADLMVAFK